MNNLKHKKLKEKKYVIKDEESGYDKRIILKTFQLPNGMTENFFIDNNKSSVQIFAITEDSNVLCVKQFRAGPEQIQVEIIGGGLEDGEDPKKAASRETLEETGHTPGEIISLGSVDYSPYSMGKKHMFLATGCRKTKDLDLDPNEFLELFLVPLKDFIEKYMRTAVVRGFDTAYLGLDYLKHKS